MPRLKMTAIVTSFLLGLSQTTLAQGRTSVRHTSNNHTEIVIHDTSPEAYKARREQARRVQKRLDQRRQRAQRQRDEDRRRAHELKMLQLKSQAKPPQRSNSRVAKSTTRYKRKRSSFFNGGLPRRSPFVGYGFGGLGFGFNRYGNRGYSCRRSYVYRPCRPRRTPRRCR